MNCYKVSAAGTDGGHAGIFLLNAEVLLDGTHLVADLVDLFGDASQVRVVLFKCIQSTVDVSECRVDGPSGLRQLLLERFRARYLRLVVAQLFFLDEIDGFQNVLVF